MDNNTNKSVYIAPALDIMLLSTQINESADPEDNTTIGFDENGNPIE